jgi:hypothetical protein
MTKWAAVSEILMMGPPTRGTVNKTWYAIPVVELARSMLRRNVWTAVSAVKVARTIMWGAVQMDQAPVIPVMMNTIMRETAQYTWALLTSVVPIPY